MALAKIIDSDSEDEICGERGKKSIFLVRKIRADKKYHNNNAACYLVRSPEFDKHHDHDYKEVVFTKNYMVINVG